MISVTLEQINTLESRLSLAMTVQYTLVGKPTSEEAIFTVTLRTFAEIQGMKRFSMSVDSTFSCTE
jgi:hypothetical protein